MKILSLIFLLASSHCFAMKEETLLHDWRIKAYPFYNKMIEGEMKNAQGMNLYYRYKLSPKAKKNLIILPGRTEQALKYAEVIYDFKDSGTNIFILDHQGQGKSDRILTDTSKSHVKKFQHYVQDFTQFMNEVVLPNSEGKNYLLSHSLGGAIAAYYLHKNPGVFEKATLCAPMFEINTKPYSETVAIYYAKFLVKTGKGNNYAPDKGPYIADEETFETSPYTKSFARFTVQKDISVNYPEQALGGPTANWVHESLLATRHIDQLKISTPILILQAGMDQTVKPARQNSFCKTNSCTIKIFPESLHEIMMEGDVIRDKALLNIKSFFGF